MASWAKTIRYSSRFGGHGEDEESEVYGKAGKILHRLLLTAYPLDCSSLRLLSMFFSGKGSTWYTAVAYIARGKAACMHIIRRENQVERERAGLSQDAAALVRDRRACAFCRA